MFAVLDPKNRGLLIPWRRQIQLNFTLINTVTQNHPTDDAAALVSYMIHCRLHLWSILESYNIINHFSLWKAVTPQRYAYSNKHKLSLPQRHLPITPSLKLGLHSKAYTSPPATPLDRWIGLMHLLNMFRLAGESWFHASLPVSNLYVRIHLIFMSYHIFLSIAVYVALYVRPENLAFCAWAKLL